MIALSFWGINIYRYGIFYFLSFIIGYCRFVYVAHKQLFARYFPRLHKVLHQQRDDLLLLIFAGVLLGGRLGHVIIYNFPYYLHHPQDIFAFRQGGMSFIGGLIGVTIVIIGFRKIKKGTWHDLLTLLDVIVVALPIGIILGRRGNYLNQELYGVVVSPGLAPAIMKFCTQFNIFHVYKEIDTSLRVNTNLLAAIGEGVFSLIIVASLFWSQIKKKAYTPGKISAIFLARYSLVRFCLEMFRSDSQREFIGRLTISQWFFVLFFLLALIWLQRIEEIREEEGK